jgi:hypothetical protein
VGVARCEGVAGVASGSSEQRVMFGWLVGSLLLTDRMADDGQGD